MNVSLPFRTRTVRLLAGALAATAATTMLQIPADRADAVPAQGTSPWSFLLCKPKGVTTPSNVDVKYFVDFLAPGTGGLEDYFRNQSRGRLTLAGSVVQGWYTTAKTTAELQAITGDNRRAVRVQQCVDAAKAGGYTVPANHKIAVYLDGSIDSGNDGGRVLMDTGPGRTSLSFVAHEMLHSYYLADSYSNSSAVVDGAAGKYDDGWDEMSAMNIYGAPPNRFGNGPVGLNAYHRDKLGWVPSDKIVSFRADGVTKRTITLAPLGSTNTTNPQLVRVPVAVSDSSHYLTVEYRRKNGYDAGIPKDTVLIHEVKDGKSYLFRQNSVAGRPPFTTILNYNSVSIVPKSVSGDTATVEITSTHPASQTASPNTCTSGYVWRGADASDYVCVTTAVRTQAYNDNQGAYFRWTSGAYGPHTCIAGYVWRGAYNGDEVCVTSTVRNQVIADNAAAASRVARTQG